MRNFAVWKFARLGTGTTILFFSLNVHAFAQTVTIEAFVDHKGMKIPTVCLISHAPPKDLCGQILLSIKPTDIKSLRTAADLQVKQKFQMLLQQ